MEHLEGLELLEKFEDDFPITEAYCQPVMRQVLASLRHIHEVVGLHHRDVKLENFRYRTRSPDSELVLVDFGLSRFVNEKWDGSVSGTLLYMAPEGVRAIAPDAEEGYTAPADVWAAGVIFYILLTGRPPWKDEAIWALGKSEAEAKELLNQTLASEHLKGVTPEAVNLLRLLLELDQQHRTTAASALSQPWLSLSGPSVQQGLQAPPECYQNTRLISSASTAWKTQPKAQPAPKRSPGVGTGGYNPQPPKRMPPPAPGTTPKKGLVKVPICLGPPLKRDSDMI